MNIVDIIIKKRNGEKLSRDETAFFVSGVSDDSIADYQISAFLMAAFIKGLDADETTWLTMEMANSGKTFDTSKIQGFKVDKHSTGGVADTTTLILAPLIASVGVPMIKMSGKGLGFSGGTIDKLESIPGFRVNVGKDEAVSFVKNSNIVLMSQTDDLTPADKKMYALRDVTGTVDSIPLIAASIMSKKIAAGADGIVLDVKCGSGAFMQDLASAQSLASAMTAIGKQVGRKVTAVITSMDQPLGMNIGNSLEVIEAIEVLKGNVHGDLLEVSLRLGAEMLLLAGRVSSVEDGTELLKANITNRQGLSKFRELLKQQGGNTAIIDDYSLLPIAPCSLKVLAEKEGYINKMDTSLIGHASVEAGAGRKFKEQPIDYGAGIIIKKRLGDHIKAGEVLGEIYAADEEKCQNAAAYMKKAFTIEDKRTEVPPLILKIM